MSGEKLKVVDGPAKSAGAVSRMVELPDLSGRVETLSPKSKAWEPGGATVDKFFFAPPATPAFMRSKGLPEADIKKMSAPDRV